MKKLFLSSSFCDVAEYLEDFYGEDLKGKTITFIPTASAVEEYKQYVENDRIALQNLGITIVELNIENETEYTISDTLSKNDFIYVSGGNTFYLLQELKKSKTDQLIIEHINNGKLYIGASAGSVVLSQNIEYLKKVDNEKLAPELENYSGLGIVDFYPLPHYGNEPFTEVINHVFNEFEAKINLVPISNTQVIEVQNNNHIIKGNLK